MQPQFAMGSDYAISPTIFYPPPQHQQEHPFGAFIRNQSFQSSLSQWAPMDPSSVTSSKPTGSTRPKPATNPSRKRSRDELDDDEEILAPSGSRASMEVVAEPIYGPGMTLIDANTGRSLAAESQTGTWYEDHIEEERLAAAKAAEEFVKSEEEAKGRPSKSVRLDSPVILAQSEMSNTTSFTSITPAIDAASLVLGVGWKEIPADDSDMQCAVRGWAKYIENHYPLGAVEILLKSEGQEAFVVRALEPQEGWWLFKEDLSEGRLVGSNWEKCLAGLRTVPMMFEGVDTICAARTPPRMSEEPQSVPDLGSQVSVAMKLTEPVGMEID